MTLKKINWIRVFILLILLLTHPDLFLLGVLWLIEFKQTTIPMTPLSKCCKAPVTMAHGCDSDTGHGGRSCDCHLKGGVTCWDVCDTCHKPCDIMPHLCAEADDLTCLCDCDKKDLKIKIDKAWRKEQEKCDVCGGLWDFDADKCTEEHNPKTP